MPVIPKIEKVRVFAIESPSALDFFANRTESQTLQAVCKLLGHEFASTIVRSIGEFETALNYITSINPDHLPESERRRPLCLHIAAHGNNDELGIGGEDLDWEGLADLLWAFFGKMKHYKGQIILVISACCASNQKVTNFFRDRAKKKNSPNPPLYVLTTVGDAEGEVYWRDSVVAWSLFYHQIGNAMLYSKTDIQLILDKIRLVGAGTLKYFRWDSNKKMYVHYTSTVNEHKKPVTAFKATDSSSKPKPKPRKK
jgi:hypothetical protein